MMEDTMPNLFENLRPSTRPIMTDQDAKEAGIYKKNGIKQKPLNKDRYLMKDWTLKDGEEAAKAINEVKDGIQEMSAGGSNSWVISGKYTESGAAMMSNDPHLANQIPSTWYLNELNIKGEYFTGASLPGIPMIAIGRSRDISWGITNSKADVSDWYYEKIDGDKYFHDGQWKPMTPRKETIKIRGQPDLEYNIWHTHHGPVF